jgi:hypothetical protein
MIYRITFSSHISNWTLNNTGSNFIGRFNEPIIHLSYLGTKSVTLPVGISKNK